MKLQFRRGAAFVTAAALLAALLAGCSTAQDSAGSASASVLSGKVKAEDLDAGWNKKNATIITLGGDDVLIEGEGAKAEGTTVTITAAGTYLLSGTLTGGQVVVEAPGDALVRLVLNGVALHCEDSAPIYCETADKLLVILADGSENTLTDGQSYTFPDAATDEPNAALFSKQDLTINGTGSLAVTSSYNNGIGTKDDLIIVSGDISVTAVNHAIRGRDSVTVLDGKLTLDAGKDGIQSNNTGDGKGWIELYGGVYDITAAHDGIQAETALAVFGGSYTITTGGGSVNAPAREEELMGPGGGNFPGTAGEMPDGMEMPQDGSWPTPPDGMEMPQDGTMPEAPAQNSEAAPAEESSAVSGEQAAASTEEAAADTTDSFKGIKAGGDITISGGVFTIDSADDTLHSNADLTVSGGTFSLSSGDDAFHADGEMRIEGDPVIDVAACYEGIEGSNVTIAGGDITLVASDDGINAAGGSDDTGAGRFGADQFSGGGDHAITISGGVIRITAEYDGLDSNGSIVVTGGETYISASTIGGGEGAIDCDGTVAVTGGVFAAAGTNAFAVMGAGGSSINADGSQPVINFKFSNAQAAQTLVELRDGAGKTLVSFTAEKEFSQIALTSPELTDGESYTVYADGGEVYTVTLSGLMTSVSDTGENVDIAMPGPGGMGGMQGGMAG